MPPQLTENAMKQVQVIDSHTGGEPTRLVISGFPDLPGGTMTEKRDALRDTHDRWRRACLLEPRGNDVLVGSLLDEKLLGGPGRDVARGGPGRDVCDAETRMGCERR